MKMKLVVCRRQAIAGDHSPFLTPFPNQALVLGGVSQGRRKQETMSENSKKLLEEENIQFLSLRSLPASWLDPLISIVRGGQAWRIFFILY